MSTALSMSLGFLVCLVLGLFGTLIARRRPRMDDQCRTSLLLNHDCGQKTVLCERCDQHDGCHAAHTDGFDIWWQRREKL